MKIHKIKLNIEFCDAVLNGEKTFEIRINDRGYQKGDKVKFESRANGLPCHHEIDNREYVITYVLNGFGLKEDYVVFGIKEEQPITMNFAGA